MQAGDTLVGKLTEWAAKAGWSKPMREDPEADWLIEANPPPFVGTFEDAARYLEAGFQYKAPKPHIILSHKSKSLLIVKVQ